MERKLLTELEKWRLSSQRKPLILQGARQVGKTWLLKEFARRSYKNFAYVNSTFPLQNSRKSLVTH